MRLPFLIQLRKIMYASYLFNNNCDSMPLSYTWNIICLRPVLFRCLIGFHNVRSSKDNAMPLRLDKLPFSLSSRDTKALPGKSNTIERYYCEVYVSCCDSKYLSIQYSIKLRSKPTEVLYFIPLNSTYPPQRYSLPSNQKHNPVLS